MNISKHTSNKSGAHIKSSHKACNISLSLNLPKYAPIILYSESRTFIYFMKVSIDKTYL